MAAEPRYIAEGSSFDAVRELKWFNSHDLWAAFDILGEGLQQEYTWSGFRGFTIHALFVLTEVPIPLH